ncbi:MAG: chromosomal replication initiator protein DnaA [Candidatus Eisenbacteria bacterium]|nr:chromosomal replication initiator protein DnaA [Candidatus Eisenbacteria bacterium]
MNKSVDNCSPGAAVSSSVGPDFWGGVLAEVRKRTTPQKFQTWFEPLQVLTLEPERLVLEVPNPFFGDWFEEHSLPLLLSVMEQTAQIRPKVHFVVSSAYYDQEQPQGPTPDVPTQAVQTRRVAPRWLHNLHPRFTFDNFVVGKSNEFAHAACRAIANDAGGLYNPLFIYGDTGLGKTHLMQAIGHAQLERNPDARVYYAPSEKFMNEMIQAITAGRTVDFRRKYRNLDLLLLDDIHFLSGRESTQEEFFHTFNTLHDMHRQIVITSDRPPRDIAKVEERLISRFSSGLVTDIQAPDLETRVAILRAKGQREGITLPEDVMFLIAERIQSNIRELEGCLVRISALAHLLQAPITTDLTVEVLRVFGQPSGNPVDVGRIQQRVAKEFDVTVESLRGKRRTARIAFARQVAMFLAKQLTPMTLVEIGKSFGNRDHTTVLYAVDKIGVSRGADQELGQRIDRISRELSGSVS